MRNNRRKSQRDGIFGEQGTANIEDMFTNLKANAQAARNSPAGLMIEKKIREHRRKRGIKKAKLKTFHDTIRTKRAKRQKIVRKQTDHFVF